MAFQMLGRGKPIFAFGAIEREILQGKIIRRAKVSRSTIMYSRHVLTARQRNVDDMVGAMAWQMPWMTDRQTDRQAHNMQHDGAASQTDKH